MSSQSQDSLLRRFAGETGDAYVLGVTRVVIGCLLFWHALVAARELEAGYFGDAFHVAMIPEMLVPSRSVYGVIVSVRLLAAALVAVGVLARPALFGSAILGIFTLLCDRVHYHHNRYALDLFALLLSLAPCDRSFVLNAPPSTLTTRTGPLWAQRLAQLQLSIIYVASGGSKLLDRDWREGRVIGDRFLRYGYQAIDAGIPRGVVEAFQHPSVSSALAKLAISTELFLAFALFHRRTRVFALWWGVWFHLTIEITSKVEIFTWLTLSIYALFATPDVGARKLFFDKSRIKGKTLARLVVWLDWLARFEVRAWEPDALRKGHVIVVVRRDGTRATGIRALAMVARCVPVLFPLWAPLALVASFTKGGDASVRA